MATTLPPSIGFRQTEILADLSAHRLEWSELRQRCGRTAFLDSGLTSRFTDSNNYMNTLLEEYFIALAYEASFTEVEDGIPA